MDNERQETIADIVAEMRKESHAGDASCLEWVGEKMRNYAYRIETAAKRERDIAAKDAEIERLKFDNLHLKSCQRTSGEVIIEQTNKVEAKDAEIENLKKENARLRVINCGQYYAECNLREENTNLRNMIEKLTDALHPFREWFGNQQLIDRAKEMIGLKEIGGVK